MTEKRLPKVGDKVRVSFETEVAFVGALIITTEDSAHGRRTWWPKEIEVLTPSTEDILNGLGEGALVAPTEAALSEEPYNPYIKRSGKWYEVQREREPFRTTVGDVADYINDKLFTVVYEGVKS